MERIKRTAHRPRRATRIFLRSMTVTAVCIVLVALGFLAAAFLTGGLH